MGLAEIFAIVFVSLLWTYVTWELNQQQERENIVTDRAAVSTIQ